MKLTAPQRKLLEEIAEEPKHVVYYFKPSIKLREMGLAAYGSTPNSALQLQITDAGRKYLQENQ